MNASDIVSTVFAIVGLIAVYYLGLTNGRIEVQKKWDEWMRKILSERDEAEKGGAE